jgi:hypothetical protein
VGWWLQEKQQMFTTQFPLLIDVVLKLLPFFADFLFQLGFEIFHRVAQCVNPLTQMRHFIGCAGHLQFRGIAVS